DFTMVSSTNALGLARALAERLVAGVERHGRCVRFQDVVEQTRRRPHLSPSDPDEREPFAIEDDQRVEEVEQHGAKPARARHSCPRSSGFRAAKPSSSPCQYRISRSPYFQQRFTTRPLNRCGKSM